MNDTSPFARGASQPVTLADSTAILRRCTAVAARARMDVLIAHRPDWLAELDAVLDEVDAWRGRRIEPVDPPMLAIAVAALEDLCRTVTEEADSATVARIATALEILVPLADRSAYRRAA